MSAFFFIFSPFSDLVAKTRRTLWRSKEVQKRCQKPSRRYLQSCLTSSHKIECLQT